jgi:hypothetical protein
MGAGVVWGWVFGNVWALARWESALWTALAFLLLGCAVVAIAFLVRMREGVAEATPSVP